MSAVASLEQVPGGSLGQEREDNTRERGRDQGLEEAAGNHFQSFQGQVRAGVFSAVKQYVLTFLPAVMDYHYNAGCNSPPHLVWVKKNGLHLETETLKEDFVLEIHYAFHKIIL